MADDTARRPGARRTVPVAVATWLAVVVVAAAVAWFAIARAGSEVLDPAAQRIPAPGTSTTSTTTTTTTAPTDPGTTTTPPATTPPSSTGTPVPPAATPVEKVVTVTGGQAGFRCTGTVLELKFAQPDYGWSVETSASDGGARLRVELERDGERTRVEATCAGGGPSVTVEEHSSGGGGGGGGGGSGGGGDDD
ncbi:hypothetical protein GCM10028777_15240 [Angustibacter speluncae]